MAPNDETAPSGDDFQSKYLLAAAEVENTKKRMQRRADEAARALRKQLLLRFLPVLDNLERALEHPDSPNLRAGLDATVRAFEDALESEGVTRVATDGQRFDPSVAEAVATQPAPGVPDDTVVAETRRGYRIGDDVVRPAHVVVAKNA